MKRFIRLILKFPFQVVAIPFVVLAMFVIVWQYRDSIRERETKYVIEAVWAFMDICDDSIDVTLIVLTIGLYGYLMLDSNDTTDEA